MTNAELIVSAAVDDAVNAVTAANESMLLSGVTIPSPFPSVKKGKNIDWNSQREAQLVTLVMKHNAYKKSDKTMEEKWSNLSRELFSMDSFKNLQPLDGYTLQKKFLRLKKKVAGKFELDEENPQNSVQLVISLLPEMDSTEKLLCKLIVEGNGGGNYRKDRNSHYPSLEDPDILQDEYSTMYAAGGNTETSFVHNGEENQDTEVINLATSEEISAGILADSAVSGQKRSYQSTFEYAFFEFEKEKERKRMTHEQEMEKSRLEAENKQQVLRLELDLKRAEIEAKQADAMKAQSQLTFELILEMKKLRQQITETGSTPNDTTNGSAN